MSDKKDDYKFGWEGDLWADQRDNPDPDLQDFGRQAYPGSNNIKNPDAVACRNFGVAALISSILAFGPANFIGMVLSLIFSSSGISRGQKARSDGCDDTMVKSGMILCKIARVLAVIYLVLILIALGIVFVFIFYLMPKMARVLP